MSLNILIVDDSDIIRKMIARTLRLTDLDIREIHEAGNGREALNLLGKHWVDLVLADINMPVMDGARMIETMREERDMADIPVIVISTEGATERIEQLMSRGVAAWIRKPFTPEQIRDVIREAIESWPPAPDGATVDDALAIVAERFAFVFPEVMESAELPMPDGPLMLAQITFTGAATGRLDLAAPEALCADLASYMLGEAPGSDISRDRAADALAEFVNMTCGQLTTRVDPNRSTDLQPPVVTRMTAGEWQALLENPTTRGYDVDGHPLALSVSLRQSRAATAIS